MKMCRNCLLEKSNEEFNKKSSTKDGLRDWCRKCDNEYARMWRKNNPKKHSEINMRSYKKLSANPEWLKDRNEYGRKARKLNSKKYRETDRKRRLRIKDTVEYKLRGICCNLNKRALSPRWSSKVPYSSQQLKQRIEMNFKPGMSWDNWGEWHIDHKKPVKRFIDQGITNPALINSLANLQPLWAKDNISKGAKFERKSH